MDIRKKARRLAHFYQSRNPFDIIKGMNVILVFYPLEGVRGFYQYFQRNHIIYVDERLPEHERLFVCAHELGHMLLHKKSNALFMDTRTFFNISKYEKEADIFAMELLLSDDVIKSYEEMSIEQIARLTGYSQKLIELRLK